MEKTIYAFQGGSDGGNPEAGVIFDQSGNLYGASFTYGSGGGGTVVELSPSNATGPLTYCTVLSVLSRVGPERTRDGSAAISTAQRQRVACTGKATFGS